MLPQSKHRSSPTHAGRGSRPKGFKILVCVAAAVLVLGFIATSSSLGFSAAEMRSRVMQRDQSSLQLSAAEVIHIPLKAVSAATETLPLASAASAPPLHQRFPLDAQKLRRGARFPWQMQTSDAYELRTAQECGWLVAADIADVAELTGFDNRQRRIGTIKGKPCAPQCGRLPLLPPGPPTFAERLSPQCRQVLGSARPANMTFAGLRAGSEPVCARINKAGGPTQPQVVLRAGALPFIMTSVRFPRRMCCRPHAHMSRMFAGMFQSVHPCLSTWRASLCCIFTAHLHSASSWCTITGCPRIRAARAPGAVPGLQIRSCRVWQQRAGGISPLGMCCAGAEGRVHQPAQAGVGAELYTAAASDAHAGERHDTAHA